MVNISKAILLFLLMFAASDLASASFACGLVEDAQNFSAGWAEMKAYYSENPANKISCRISPMNNKFCCDLQSIQGAQWGIGKTVVSEMYDPESGLFVPKAELSISGEGFDVFADRSIRDAITLNPKPAEILLNQTSLALNVSIDDHFDGLRYRLLHSGNLIANETVCENCNESALNVTLPLHGEYEIIFSAFNDEISMEESFSFTNLEYLKIRRKLECAGCRSDFVPRNRNVNVTLMANFSHNVEGTLKEYFPIKWGFIGSEEGEVSEHSESHKKIEMDFSGSSLLMSYQLKSPNNIFPKSYRFFYELGETGDSSIVFVAVNGALRFMASGPDFSEGREMTGKKFSFVSGDFPLLIEGDGIVTGAAIFPKGVVKGASGTFNVLNEEDYTFEISSDIGDSRIDKVMIKFRWGSAEEPELIFLGESGQETVEFTLKGSDEEHKHYEAFHDKAGVFSIRAKK